MTNQRLRNTILIGVLGAVAIYWLWPRGETFESVSNSIDRDFSNQKSTAFVSHLTAEDLRLYSVSAQDAEKLMESYVLPSFDFKQSRMQIVPQNRDVVMVDWECRATNGRVARLELLLSKDRGKIHIVNGITNVLLSTGYAKYYEQISTQNSGGKFIAFKKQAELDGPKLSELGFKGIFRLPSEGVILWKSWASKQDERLLAISNSIVNMPKK